MKAVSVLVAPVTGTVEAANEDIQSNPEILNEDPYEKGWLVVIKPSDLQPELQKIMNFDKAVEWHKSLIEEA